ncbi:hypothetical protein BCV70DRAFT_57151 [Testicularia cyperi]|uniref:Uncharacterized protein n=1 Tax=Testicularia cyperi TaxID=1882483 RepID=A0A317XUS0_9BASI|nr:hypothetical protein BCV70DRAFT_57151 [Testicularia cyperi]
MPLRSAAPECSPTTLSKVTAVLTLCFSSAGTPLFPAVAFRPICRHSVAICAPSPPLPNSYRPTVSQPASQPGPLALSRPFFRRQKLSNQRRLSRVDCCRSAAGRHSSAVVWALTAALLAPEPPRAPDLTASRFSSSASFSAGVRTHTPHSFRSGFLPASSLSAYVAFKACGCEPRTSAGRLCSRRHPGCFFVVLLSRLSKGCSTHDTQSNE